MNYPSKLLEEAVQEFSRLPGVGKKTALRLVLHLLKQDAHQVEQFGKAINKLKQESVFCSDCHSLSDVPVCPVCASPRRDEGLVCVVSDIRDVMAIENTGNFSGKYHVLGGIISPVDGVGPRDLTFESLEKRVMEGKIRELILALPASMEGETTAFYIFRKFSKPDLAITVIARGLGVADELEYADEVSLSRSILQRTPFDRSAQTRQNTLL